MKGMSDGIGMDCSIRPSKKYDGFFLVSTIDYFYPLVEDPYLQGKIACANVLSDMYALGVVDVDSLLMVLAVSTEMPRAAADIVTKHMLKGFNDLAAEAGTEVTGGQTVKNPWATIGGVAKSICKEGDFIMPRGAQAGDRLVLTKPLGTQVAVNVKQWMRSEAEFAPVADVITRDSAEKAYAAAQASMARLNRVAARLMHRHGAHAATDVTGFGIKGHLDNLASNQTANVSMVLERLPCIRGMAAVDRELGGMFRLEKGLSAETSGGLLIALPAEAAEAFCRDMLAEDGHEAWIVGRVEDGGGRTARFDDDCTVVEV